MLFITRLKVLLKRKSILFWIALFPILLASAEYFAFGKFIHSTPIDTIPVGIIEEKTSDLLLDIFENAKIEENKPLYEIKKYTNLNEAETSLKNKEITLYLYEQEEEIQIVAKSNSISLTVTESIISQVSVIETTIKNAYQQYYNDVQSGKNPQEVNPEQIIQNFTKDSDFFNDLSSHKNATFYTFYFYSLMAMSCLFAALFGSNIINDVRADCSSLGIRISSSVVSKNKIILTYFLASALLQAISSVILYLYLAFVLKVALVGNVGLILLTLILGGISGILIGMLVATLVKGNESKCEGIITAITLSLSCFAGLMSVEVKHLVDQNLSFINWINPASLVTNSLYALYYYDNYTNYIIYTCILFGICLLAILGVIFKTRGEKYASL